MLNFVNKVSPSLRIKLVTINWECFIVTHLLYCFVKCIPYLPHIFNLKLKVLDWPINGLIDHCPLFCQDMSAHGHGNTWKYLRI